MGEAKASKGAASACSVCTCVRGWGLVGQHPGGARVCCCCARWVKCGELEKAAAPLPSLPICAPFMHDAQCVPRMLHDMHVSRTTHGVYHARPEGECRAGVGITCIWANW